MSEQLNLMKITSLLWLRHDLRLADNPALDAAKISHAANDCAGQVPLNTAKESLDGNFHRLGNPQQRLDGNDFFTAFNLAKIFGVQVHGLCQLLLGEAEVFTMKMNGLANYFAMPFGA